MKVRGNFAQLLAPGIRDALLRPRKPKWMLWGYKSEADFQKAVAKEMAKRAADPDDYDRETIGMMPRIPH